jgi:glutamate decarboxylase
MTMDTIASDLEASRDKELTLVLEAVTKKLVNYAKKNTDPETGSVGISDGPRELSQKLKLELPQKGQEYQGLLKDVDMLLDNSAVTWNPGFLEKLYASTNPVGIASDMLLSILNTNSHVFTVSPALSLIENKVGHEYAKMFGFEGKFAGGLTFPGGSYSNSTSLTMARSIKFPDTKTKGNGNYRFAVFASAHAHYSVEKAAIFCGMGSESVFKVNVDETGCMIVSQLEDSIERAKSQGFTPLYVNATAGTTVLGSFEDLNAIADVATKHNLWMHVDGSWGGNVVFSRKRKYKLNGVARADSLTVNPHKMLGVPTTCSFLLLPDKRIFQTANSLAAPYLFHNSSDNEEENYDLADGTMGCGRRPDALKLYLGWRWYGTEGYEKRIDHAFDVTEYLARSVRDAPDFVLASEYPPPCLQTCLFYAPHHELSSDPKKNSAITHKVSHELHRQGKFMIDFAPDPNGRGDFFRVVIVSPIVSSSTVDDLLASIRQIGKTL